MSLLERCALRPLFAVPVLALMALAAPAAPSDATAVDSADLRVVNTHTGPSIAGPAVDGSTVSGPAVAGGSTAWTLALTNQGPGDSTDVVVTNNLPADATFDASASDDRCSESTPGYIRCSVGDLAIGSGTSVLIAADLDSGTTGPITNHASISAAQPDPDQSNNVASSTVDIEGFADLAVTTALVTTDPRAGGLVEWSASLENFGPSDAHAAHMTYTFGPELQLNPAASDDRCTLDSPGLAVCDLSTLRTGTTAELTLVFRSASTVFNDATLTNTARGSSDSVDSDPSNNSASSDALFVREADLAAQIVGPGSVVAGETISFDLILTNNGPSHADNPTLTNALGASITSVSVTGHPSCSVAGNTVSCSPATLAPGEVVAATVVGTVASDEADEATLSNTVSGASDTSDPVVSNDSSTSTTAIVREVDLILAKTPPRPVGEGTESLWELTVTNDGPSDATNLVVVDQMPAGLAFRPDLSSPACSPGVTCALPDLPAGQSITVVVGSMVEPDRTSEATLMGIAEVTSAEVEIDPASNRTSTPGTAPAPDAPTAASSEDTTTSPSADLSVTKVVSASVATPGVPLTYEIAIFNDGPSDASNLSLIDALPPGSVLHSVAPTSQCEATAGSATCEFQSLAAGSTQMVTIKLTPEPWLQDGSIFEGNVVVTGAEPDPDSANNGAQARIRLERKVDVSLAATPSKAKVSAGDSLIYDIVASNSGPSDADGLAVSNILSSQVSFNPDLSSPGCSVTGSTVSCPLPSVEAGSSGSVSIGVEIDPTASGTITNTTTVKTAEINTNVEPTVSVDVAVAEFADLTLSKTAASAVVAGESLSYNFAVYNNGPGLAEAVVVTDKLPPELTIKNIDPNCIAEADLLKCDLGDLAAGETVTAVLAATVDPSATQTITNTATVSSESSETTPADNVASSTTTVTQVADLSISKAAVSTDAVAGGKVTWLIEILNQGPSAASEVLVTDLLPDSLGFVPEESSEGCTTQEVLTCAVPSISAGETATLTLATDIANTAFGLVTSTASVESPQEDPNPATATTTAVVDVRRPDAQLAVTKSGSESRLKSGDTVAWTVVVSNTGSEPILTPVTITDTIPAGHTVQGIASGPLVCIETSGTIECELPGLSPGESVELRVQTVVLADQTAAISTVTVSAAGVDGGSGDDGSVIATSTAQVPAAPGLGLSGNSVRLLLTLAFGAFLLGWFLLGSGEPQTGTRRSDR